ncbi:MAG: hypothetical protein IKE69_10425 [Thermoguttaceae bacterium]|nr:hypothetical protein [Thermoguttaceae bacterium]
MFNPDHLLKLLKERLTEPEPVGAPPRAVNLGNGPFPRGGKPIRYDVAAAPGGELPFTETAERRVWHATVTVTAAPGTGLARLYDAARRVASLYTPFDPRRGAFRAGGARFYVTAAAIDAPRVESGEPRAAVRLTLVAESPRGGGPES